MLLWQTLCYGKHKGVSYPKEEVRMNWNTDSTVSREEAKGKIQEIAREEGIKGAFKVFYDGQLMSTPDNLPEQVDMDKVSVSAVLDQA